MKISCQSCGAKYNIADEKVRGKIVKIACKKCGARIEIDGRAPTEQANDQDETRVYDQASASMPGGAPSTDVWTVSVDDSDQREVTTPQLLELLQQGTITADTFVWREGMADWQMIRDVDGLRDQIPAGGASMPGHQISAGSYDYSTSHAPSGPSNGGSPKLPAVAAAVAPHAYSAPQIDTSKEARLGGSRRGGSVDLFGNAQPQTEDDDVATSAPTAGAALAGAMSSGGDAAVDARPIGARNENSVLFSLAALTSSGPSTPAAHVTEEEKSGLIDIQKLAAAGNKGGKLDDRAKLDDIMNLGGGGAFNAALGGPILAPPPAAALEAAPEDRKKGGLLLYLLIGMGAIIVLLLLVLVLRGGSKDDTAGKDKKNDGLSAPTASATTKGTATEGTVAVAPTDTATAAATETAPDPAGSGPIGSKKPGAAVGGPKAPAGGTATTAAAKDTATAAPPPAPTGGGGKPCKTLEECMGAKTPDKPPAAATTAAPAGGGGGGAEFDKGAARAALQGIPYKDCGSGGAGSVTVTFAPSGSAVGANVSGDYDGATKACVAGRFRGAKVPAFGGPPKPVGWKISL